MIIRINNPDGSEAGKPKKQRKSRGPGFFYATNILITLLFALVYYYVKLPAINLKNPAFYGFFLICSALYCVLALVRKLGLSVAHETMQSPRTLFMGLKNFCAVPAILCGGLILLFIVGSIISAPIFRARDYSELLQPVESSFTEDIDEISFDQIPMLDENSANTLANRKLGELSDLVSQFEVHDESYQINYNDRPVRVTFLNYGDIFKWLKNTSKGIPAYMIVDMVTQEVTVQRLPEGIRYSPSEYFFRFPLRALRFQYPTLMFDDINFEIDEEGKPWWVASVITKRIGLFGGEDVIGAVLLDAVSGESSYYEARDIPTWVDRAFTAGIIMEQYNYHGMYKNGFINSLFAQTGCTVTTQGYNYIAQDDDVWVYTGITSVGGDESNIGFILVNQRTKEARYYAIPGATEYSAMASAQGAVQQFKYTATFPLLLNIEGQPTYFMAMKDASQLVKMYAMVNVQQYQIVATAQSLTETEAAYVAQLEKNKLVEAAPEMPSTVPDTVSVSGTVMEIRSAVINGWTHYYLLLDDGVWYDCSIADGELPVILNVGDAVVLQTAGTEGEIVRAYSAARG